MSFLINPYFLIGPPEVPTTNLVAHYQPEGMSRHGLVTIISGAELDTAQSKIGNSSLLLAATADSIDITDSDDFAFGAADFTIEFWIRPTEIGTTSSQRFYYHQDFPDTIEIVYTTSLSGTLNFTASTDGALAIYQHTGVDSLLTNNVWHHIAMVRDGTTGDLYINGVGGATEASSFGTKIVDNVASDISIGPNQVLAHYDEMRISTVKRYTGSFTPQTTPFVADSDTVYLNHFEGTDASTRIYDSALSTSDCLLWVDDSGNEHDMTQSAGANTLSGVASALDGFTGMVSNGTTDFFSITDNNDMDQNGNISLIFVFKSADSSGWLMSNSHGAASFFASTISVAINGSKGFFRRGTAAAEWDVMGSVSIDDDTYRAVSFIDNGTSMEILVNNVVDVDSTPGSYSTPAVTTSAINLGRRHQNNDAYLAATFIEVLVYNTDLDSATRTQLQDYLENKYPSI